MTVNEVRAAICVVCSERAFPCVLTIILPNPFTGVFWEQRKKCFKTQSTIPNISLRLQEGADHSNINTSFSCQLTSPQSITIYPCQSHIAGVFLVFPHFNSLQLGAISKQPKAYYGYTA